MTPRSVVLDVFVRGLHPFMLALSAWVLFRGHDAPGGGFIAGLIAVAATAVLAVARGSRSALRYWPGGPVRLAALSTLLSLGSGLPALALGLPFMTHLWFDVSLGVVETSLSTVLLFDIGVYGVVWSALGGLAASIIGIDEEGPR